MRGTVEAMVGKPAVRKVTKAGEFCDCFEAFHRGVEGREGEKMGEGRKDREREMGGS
jgi:hypothetical protein